MLVCIKCLNRIFFFVEDSVNNEEVWKFFVVKGK